MSSEQLVKIGGNPAALASSIAGLEDFGPVKVAAMELVQRTSRAVDAQFGKFRDRLTNEHFDVLKVVPLTVTRGRVLFAPGGDLNTPAICRSSDGIVPSEFVDTPQHHECKSCPKSSWGNFNRKTKTGKPECQEKWRLLFIERETSLPYWMSFGGTSLKPLKDILQGVQRHAIAETMKGNQKAIYDYSFTMRPQRVDGPKGSYYVVLFDPPTQLKDEDRNFGPLFEEFVKKQRAFREEAANEGAVNQEFSEFAEA